MRANRNIKKYNKKLAHLQPDLYPQKSTLLSKIFTKRSSFTAPLFFIIIFFLILLFPSFSWWMWQWFGECEFLPVKLQSGYKKLSFILDFRAWFQEPVLFPARWGLSAEFSGIWHIASGWNTCFSFEGVDFELAFERLTGKQRKERAEKSECQWHFFLQKV